MIFKICIGSALAGILIAIAGALYVGSSWLNMDVVKRDDFSELFHLAGSVAFSLGLLTICACKFDLFTGKVGSFFEVRNDFDNKCLHLTYLLFILVMNLAFAGGAGVAMYYALKKTHFTAIVHSIVDAKTNISSPNSYVKTALQSVFCGSCVHMAVKGFQHNFIFCILFVTAFVYNNFQHCIANMFYFGVMFKEFRYEMLINEGIAIVGNIIGTIPIALLVNKLNSVDASSSSISYSQPAIRRSRKANQVFDEYSV